MFEWVGWVVMELGLDLNGFFDAWVESERLRGLKSGAIYRFILFSLNFLFLVLV